MTRILFHITVLMLFFSLSACSSGEQQTRELLPEADKDIREKYEKKQDSIRQLQGTKIPTH